MVLPLCWCSFKTERYRDIVVGLTQFHCRWLVRPSCRTFGPGSGVNCLVLEGPLYAPRKERGATMCVPTICAQELLVVLLICVTDPEADTPHVFVVASMHCCSLQRKHRLKKNTASTDNHTCLSTDGVDHTARCERPTGVNAVVSSLISLRHSSRQTTYSAKCTVL